MIRKGYHGNSHIRKVKVVSGASVQPNLVWDIPEWKDKIQKRWKEMHVCFFQVCCFAVVQLLIFTTPWTAACQAPLSSSISWSLLKFMSIELVMLTISSSAALFFFCLPSFPASGSFPVSRLFLSGGQSIRASPSASVLLMNLHGWSPLGWAGLISLQSRGLSRVFCSTAVWRHQFFGTQLSL